MEKHRTKRVYLVRHCESTGQASDAPLTPRGFAQAQALSSHLAGVGAQIVVSSPYLRAHQSVSPLTRGSGLPLRLDSRLAERRLSGQPLENWRDAIRQSFDDPELVWPGGESCRTAMARGRAALMDVLARPEETSVVATHGNLMTLILRSFDSSHGFTTWEKLSNPDVFCLVFQDGGVQISRTWEAPGD